MSKPVITAYDWVPWFARGLVRDLRVRWALEEEGRDYAVRTLSQGSQKALPHRTLQPFGQIPTYEHDGLTLFESGAIVQYIAETHGRLLPSDPAGRARAIEWMYAALNTVEPPIMDYAIATLFEDDKPWSKPRLPAVMERIAERLDELAKRLGEKDWLDGDFSAGDLLMIAVLRQLKDTPLETAHANLAAYVARGEARPAFQRALAAQLADFTGKPPPGYEFLDQPPAQEGESK
jgi:glutathione S-transferase